MSAEMRIHVDADGCPVREEVYRVAARYGVAVVVVANHGVDVPATPGVERVVVGGGANAADDWIVEHVAPGDIVVTADVPLAGRCLAKGAQVLQPTGRRVTDDDIGSALAMRDLLASIRESGGRTRGPAPFRPQDRSQFLQSLDAAVHRQRRKR